MEPPQADNYAYEEEQERKALLQGLHGPMKQWYNGSEAASIRARFGPFPTFWQDLLTWEHTRSLQKLYLRWMDTGAPAESLLKHLDSQLQQEQAAADAAAPKVEEKQEQEQEEEGAASAPAAALAANGDTAAAPAAAAAASSNGDGAKPAGEGEQQQPQQPQQEGGEAADKPKKRKSRWGDDNASTSSAGSASGAGTGTGTGRKSRWGDPAPADGAIGGGKKSRWSQPDPAALLAAAQPQLSPDTVQEIIALQLRLDDIHRRQLTLPADALAAESDPNKSPSPPPIYDSQGKRLNTREERMRQGLRKERQEVIERMLKVNPVFQPPRDYVRQKPHRKLYIPQKDYPNYNFIGLIIGPRGATQKEMERTTNTKISIRGKGSVKEGARTAASKGPADDDNDDLHVYIVGEKEEDVEAAAKLVGEFLVPIDDEYNTHKQQQLRQLALINGTLREEGYCNICGEKGHKQFECPLRHSRHKTVQVKCAICGDTSHPTRDCRMGQQGGNGEGANKEVLDKEYMSFMAELGEGPPPEPSPSSGGGNRPPPRGGPGGGGGGGGRGGGGHYGGSSGHYGSSGGGGGGGSHYGSAGGGSGHYGGGGGSGHYGAAPPPPPPGPPPASMHHQQQPPHQHQQQAAAYYGAYGGYGAAGYGAGYGYGGYGYDYNAYAAYGGAYGAPPPPPPPPPPPSGGAPPPPPPPPPAP